MRDRWKIPHRRHTAHHAIITRQFIFAWPKKAIGADIKMLIRCDFRRARNSLVPTGGGLRRYAWELLRLGRPRAENGDARGSF